MSGRRSFLPYPAEIPGEAPAEGAAALDALANYVAIDQGAPAATGAAPADVIVAAIVLTPKTTGIFRIDAALTTLTDSASEEVSVAVVGLVEAVPGTPIAMVGGTAASQNGSAVGAPSASAGGQVSAGAGGITFTGAAGGAQLSLARTPAVATDPLHVQAAAGIFSHSTGGTTKTPFPIGETCALALNVTAPAGTLSGMLVNFTVQEEPFA